MFKEQWEDGLNRGVESPEARALKARASMEKAVTPEKVKAVSWVTDIYISR